MSEPKRENPTWEQIQRDRDKRVEMPLDADEALRGLLAVDPESEPKEAALSRPPAREK